MSEWLGIYEIVVNEKNQVTLPKRFREQLPGELLVGPFPEGFLIACDPKFKEDAFWEVPETEGELFGVDGDGRLLLPQTLLVHANLDDGQAGWVMWFPKRVEIWEKGRWNGYLEGLGTDLRQIHLRREFIGDPFLRN